MYTTKLFATALVGASTALAGDLLWDGRFTSTTASKLSAWSWSNAVGAYQYYIHGSGAQSDYVNIDAGFKNPADTASTNGAKITIDDTAYWNGQNMRRTELIPETTAAINSGKVYYHFSIQHTATNPPSQGEEHQIAFFESHFTELKSGLLSGSSGASSNALYWQVGGVSHWNISDWTAGVWHNIAYGIDFDAKTVEFYHSTDAADLSLVAGPLSAETSSNGKDWHLGVLRLAGSDASADNDAEDFYFSGVYVESGDVTLSVSGPKGSADTGSSSSSAVSSTVAATSSVAATTAPSSSAMVESTAAVSTAVAAVTSSAYESSSAAAYSAPSSVAPSTVPTTLQTQVKSSSSAVAPTSSAPATSSTIADVTSSASAPISEETGSDGCTVEYAYV